MSESQLPTSPKQLMSLLDSDSVKYDYFEHEAVLQAFGWPTSPPQPTGYPLAKHLDLEKLETVKKRGPIWRSAD